MASIKSVLFALLYLADNVRRPGCERVPEMVASLKMNGFKPNHPLVVSQKGSGDDVRYLVLVGNRRSLGLQFLQANDVAEFERILPNGKIPCVVHTGLTEAQEIDIRNDHSPDEDRVPLDEYSKFLAIKQLMRVFPTDSETKIAEKMGIRVTKAGKNFGTPNRSYVQPRCNLARLPGFVQEEYRKLCELGTESTPFRVTDIKGLSTVANSEYVAFPNGDGPAFTEAWGKIMNKPAKVETATDAVNAPKELTAKEAISRGQGCSSLLVKQLLLAATNQGERNLVELDVQISTIVADSTILSDIRDFLSVEDYNQLVTAAQSARIERESQAATPVSAS